MHIIIHVKGMQYQIFSYLKKMKDCKCINYLKLSVSLNYLNYLYKLNAFLNFNVCCTKNIIKCNCMSRRPNIFSFLVTINDQYMRVTCISGMVGQWYLRMLCSNQRICKLFLMSSGYLNYNFYRTIDKKSQILTVNWRM